MPEPDIPRELEAVQTMVHCRLMSLAAVKPESISAAHLDEDTMSSFVEGMLTERESETIITHLTSCGSCRDFTARLIRLESFSDADQASTIAEEPPGRLRRFFEDFASQVASLGGEDAVFAYQNPEEKTDSAGETPSKKEKDEE